MGMHKVTVSNEPFKRQTYERAARQEETFVMTASKGLVEGMPAPKGRHANKAPPSHHRYRCMHGWSGPYGLGGGCDSSAP